MKSLMQPGALTIGGLLRRVEHFSPGKSVLSVLADGTTHRGTHLELCDRARHLAGALDALAVPPDARVGTFCWNSQRHVELYLGVPLTGRIVHTINVRLSDEQIRFIVRDAEDDVLFVDRSLAANLLRILSDVPSVRHVVVIDDGVGAMPGDPRVLDYEDLIASSTPVAEDRVEDEHAAAGMCYTSGTTGDPKGVLYSHRSTVLHAWGTLMANSLGIVEDDVILPVVPMFHANAWGMCHAAMLAGATLVLPGRDVSGSAIARLIAQHEVTLTAAVPSVWLDALEPIAALGHHKLRMVLAGGSAVPRALSERYRERVGLPISQGWGMTETSPIAALSNPPWHDPDADVDALATLRAKQGRPVIGIEARIVEPGSATELPWDGTTRGELQVRGPWVARAYYGKVDDQDSFSPDGWLRTGDVATISSEGYVELVDRTKDMVKSGGEWISSIALENEIMAHPDVLEAAVIAIPHPRWMERPLACVVAQPGATLTADDVLSFLEPRVPKWWMPDEVVFVNEIPKTSVGKFSKRELREQIEARRTSAAAT